uniref:Origin recognition complex subunit 2 n=1 Tax=Cacopsylla melanoneura TaxID=428564 RepID=A0A8D8Q176_9HEMI
MYQRLRSRKKAVEAILITNKDVEIIKTLQDLEKEKQVDTLKRKKEATQKKNVPTSNIKGKDTKRKVISSKVVSSRQSKSFKKIKNDSKVKKSSQSGSEDTSDACDDEDEFVPEENKKKPTSLFEEDDQKVSNQQIFGFQTPKRKNGMQLKAEDSMKNSPKAKENLTPKSSNKKLNTPQKLSKVIIQSPRASLNLNASSKKTISRGDETPKSDKRPILCKTPLSAKFVGGKSPRPLRLTCDSPTLSEEKENKVDDRRLKMPKTPYSLRTKLKNRICHETKENQFQDDDSGSEFEASDGELSSNSSEDSPGSEDGGSSPENAPVQKKPRIILKITNQNESSVEFKPRRGGRKRELSYIFKADDYFTYKSGKQVTKTSNNTLKKTPQISRDNMVAILNEMRDNHEICKKELTEGIRALFMEWLLFLRENFNLLLYGFGSKYKVMDEFYKKMLSHSKVLVINGFFPDLTLKEILESIMIDLLDMKEASQDPQQAFELIKKKLKTKHATDIFLVIHNIDGAALRGNKQQSLLAQLASLQKVHIIASIDHINTPLLWDNSKLGQLNFVWFDVTNYSKYEIETSYESSLLIEQSSGKLVKSSIVNVYKSLNNNAKQIFMLIVNNHLDNRKNKQYQGVSFKDLYSWCRKGFLVTSDLTLRTQLTEFLDHELIKWRNDKEHLYIPINLSILEDFQQKQLESET